ALRLPKPRQVRRGAELPRQRTLSPSLAERLLEVVLGGALTAVGFSAQTSSPSSWTPCSAQIQQRSSGPSVGDGPSWRLFRSLFTGNMFPTLVVLRIGCPGVFVRTFCLAAQGFDGNPVRRLDEFMRHRLKLFQDRGGLSKLGAGRKVFQVGRLVACDRGER